MSMELEDYLDGVDDSEIEASHGRPPPFPAGEYMLELVSREFKPNSSNTGIILACEFKVSEGEYENRRVFYNFNIRNKSQKAQTIGLRELKGLCAAVGEDWLAVKADTSLLIGRPFLASVGFSKTTPVYPDPRNEIKAFKKPGGSPPEEKAAAKPAAKAIPAAAGKKLPGNPKLEDLKAPKRAFFIINPQSAAPDYRKLHGQLPPGIRAEIERVL